MKTFDKLFLLSLFFFGFTIQTFAQPANDECVDAIVILDVINWCSGEGAYTNVNATASTLAGATCFSNNSNDVWFRFTAVATDITLTIGGNSATAPGGTLNNPEVAIYIDNNCTGTFNEIGCEVDAFNTGLVELYEGGLIVGQSYLIRVEGDNNNVGTFEICMNMYNPPVQPGSDCVTSSVLCDQSPFVVQSVIGAGNDNTELDNAPCLNLGTVGINESNSTWFSWTCDQSGTLTFDLEPLATLDDLDFVVFRLNSGIENCNDKTIIRCMASGDNPINYPSPCFGPTGLADGETDLEEPAGCLDPTQNNYLAPLNMISGESYALVVNNFTSAGNGFNISFGGTGTFLGPEVNFTSQPSQTICYGDLMSFTDLSSFSLGDIISWEWAFGVDAVPAASNDQNPPDVYWDSPGTKAIVLTVETDLGCIVTEINTIEVEACCNAENIMTISDITTDVDCADSANGSIDLTVSSNAPGYTYQWDPDGQSSEDLTSLLPGDYTVTITNAATCDTILTFTVDSPPPLDINFLVVRPTCDGGIDGSITLGVGGGTFPYLYNWENTGFTMDNTLNNLSHGTYSVIVQDANLCEEEINIEVFELELFLDAANAVTPPLCDDSFDGSINLIVTNGLGPYLFDWDNDAFGFIPDNTLGGLNNGTFSVTFEDANGCQGDTLITITPPLPIIVELDTVNVSCFGQGDGSLDAMPSGGVGSFTYIWSDGQTTAAAIDLVPGDYTVSVYDANGCEEIATGTITQPAELDIQVINIVHVICNGDESGSISVLGFGGNPEFEYSVNGIDFQSDTLFTELAAGTYDLIVLDMLGCTDTVQATIVEPPPLLVFAGDDQTVDLGFTADLEAIVSPLYRPVTFTWTPEGTLDCLDCPDPTVLPPNTTTYTVTVVDETDCIASDEVTVFVVKNRPIYIPNAFSPNYDGNNDGFTLYGGPAARKIQLLRVYNRWGALVFEANDIPLNEERFGWDGTFKGQEMTPAVFAFYAIVEFIDNETVLLEGDVSIIK